MFKGHVYETVLSYKLSVLAVFFFVFVFGSLEGCFVGKAIGKCILTFKVD